MHAMLSSSPQAVASTPKVQATAARPIRSKGGCLTCKAKHSKCDETRPTCKRCVAKGLQCGGYVTKAPWTFKHLVFQPVLEQSLGPSSSVHSARPKRTQEEQDPTIAATWMPSPSAHTTRKRGSPVSRHTKQQRKRSDTSVPTTASPPSAASTEKSVQRTQSRKTHPQVPVSPAARLSPAAPPTTPPITSCLTDRASAFIINWFQDVCAAWSGFDSDANWNRKIAIDLWQSSAAVNSALESMSASFLASRVPKMRQASLHLMSRATELIQAELNIVKNQPFLYTIPTGVMFAMFCMGTTICWVNSRGLGLPFFRELRALLRRLNAQPPTALSRSSLEMLDFFKRSMIYCEMLLAVVSDDHETGPLSDNPPMADTEPDLSQTAPEMLHPWTGVSTLSAQLVSESIRLCRSARARLRQPFHDVQAYHTAALEDLRRAQNLEERLLALDVSTEAQQVSDTGDLATPQLHLNMTAEAYRLAALLHLYQTFRDLTLKRLPVAAADAGSPPPTDATLWDDWIVPLALHLVKILKQIPPSSGSRVIQPLLYISAATGLRHSTSVSVTKQSDSGFGLTLSSSVDDDRWSCGSWQQQSLYDSDTLLSYVTQFTNSGDGGLSEPGIPDVFLEISCARQFILERLGIFETSLPPAPIGVAKELVSLIWNSYDNDHDLGDGLYMVHWIEVMELSNLRSLFG